jgi:hypothetical protein
MAPRHVVVDGSNVATEGRSTPSLAQLDEAVREFLHENPTDVVSVVVDASFGHRIDPTERAMFEEAEAAAELVSPPAGAIGRGDAFLLRIAEKTGATVLSNDSFQEFHGEHAWLFDKGRLIGGKPVPGVGWIFTPRTPVRGPRSREAVQEAKRGKKSEAESGMPGLDLAAERARGKGKGKRTVERAIAVATEEAVAPKEIKRRRRRKGGQPPADPVNEPLTFITFIAAHRLGSEVTGTVESFASHGAFVDIDGARGYLPLAAMAEPAPKSAREVLGRGQQHRFVVDALDPLRRGIELALPGFARVAGTPMEETVEAEITAEAKAPSPVAGPSRKVAARKAAATKAAATKVATRKPAGQPRQPAAEGEPVAAAQIPLPAAKEAPAAKKAPAVKKAEAAKKAPAKKAPAKKEGPPKKEAPPKKAPAKRAPDRKSATGKEPAAKTAPAKTASVKKAPVKKAPVKKASVQKAPVKKAPGKEAAAARPEVAKGASARAQGA